MCEFLHDIIYDVAVEALSSVIFVIISFLFVFLCLSIRRCRILKDLREWLYPPDRVFPCRQDITEFHVLDSTHYKSVYSEEEIKKMVSSSGKKNVFNGICVRMDKIINGKCYLSKVGFYDFLVSNLTYLPTNKNLMSTFDIMRCYIFDSEFRSVISLESRIRTRIDGYERIKSFEDVLAIDELANIITVSILLEDSNGDLLLVKRGNKVAVSSGTYAVSAAGSVAENDLTESNPFLSCATRELREELGLEVSLRCTDVVISRQKLQPAVLFHGNLSVPFIDVLEKMRNADDFKEENESLFVVPKNRVMGLVHRMQFTDVAAYQLFQASGCNRTEWLWKYCTMNEIERYKIL